MFIKEELFEKKIPEIQFPEPIMEQKKVVENLQARISSESDKLQGLISAFQEKCAHNKEVRVMSAGSELDFRIGRKKLRYFLCLDCSRIREPGKGRNACEMCDGRMEVEAYIPGQGGGYRIYKCRWCGHPEEHG